ncbi:MAG: septum formation inhibitor Maf [Candidatus Cellulosilyticum pullistercoris]|uniref:dTTP/UTP pyrophosphatase n=1 Tax=Candidatus Cellulosilyticum pullistercoris TaxID=2838521 RepID=A0A9E2NK26_9FIRM|nr:septum formation inhibitor Maf [Candidatus Cellulosilyticum pullistercoris]
MESLILASGSPRRKELMQILPWPFEVKTKEVVEVISETLSPEENVKALAYQKASAVAKDYPSRIVIGADTVVCLDGEIMGKPQDRMQAQMMLERLSGKEHHVYTGVAIIGRDEEISETFYVETKVKMQSLSREEIEAYILTNEPMDKAGAYGIQGYGARYIERIEGDYYSVMGLPVHALYEKLKKQFK